MGELLTPIRLLAHRLSGAVELSRAEIDALAGLAGPTKTFRRGEALVQQTERSAFVYLLADGWAFRQKMLANGRRQIIALMLPGELSEKGPLMPFGSPDAIVAATDVSVQSISRKDLGDLARVYPRILEALFFEELTRHAITREWVLLLGQKKAEERIGYLIYETYARLNAMGMVNGTAFDFPITQVELGDIVGMSIVHVNRTLQVLRKKQIIAWVGQRVEVLNPPALARIAQFDKGFQTMAQDFSGRVASVDSTVPHVIGSGKPN